MPKLTDEERRQRISQLLPNTFPFPNIIIDEHPAIGRSIWSVLVGPEQNLLTILYRKTFGWWKERDRISTSQLVKLSGLSEQTVRKYMINLCAFGLAVRLSDGSDGQPVLWEVQTDDSKIDFPALIDRRNKIDEVNRARWDNGRQNKGVLSDSTPIVGQQAGGVVGQQAGGVVGQYPQKPLSKTTKQKPNNSGQKKPARNDPMPERFPVHLESLAQTFIRLTGIKCTNKSEYLFWVYGNSKTRAVGLDRMQREGITSNDFIAAHKYCKKNSIALKAPSSIYTFAHSEMIKRKGTGEQPEEQEVDPGFVSRLNGE